MAFRRLPTLVQIVLVVVFGRVEGHHRADLRDGAVTHLHQFAENLDGGVALCVVVEPDSGEVLRPDVDALAIDLLKVVDFEEIAHQGFVGNDVGVIFHFDGFQMPSRSGFHLFVTRVFEFAAHESDDGLRHALEALEVILHAPKATC